MSPFFNNSQKLLKNRKLNSYRKTLFHKKTRVCLRDFENDCPLKQFFACNSPQALIKHASFDTFGNCKAFHTALTLS